MRIFEDPHVKGSIKLKKFTFAGLTAVMSSTMVSAAYAVGCEDGRSRDPVPSRKSVRWKVRLAVAALAAIVLLTWERRRRVR
jgi:hypothetical protein